MATKLNHNDLDFYLSAQLCLLRQTIAFLSLGFLKTTVG